MTEAKNFVGIIVMVLFPHLEIGRTNTWSTNLKFFINSNDISVDCETFKIGFISGNRYRDGRVNLALPGKQIRYIVLEIFTFHSVKNEVYSLTLQWANYGNSTYSVWHLVLPILREIFRSTFIWNYWVDLTKPNF